VSATPAGDYAAPAPASASTKSTTGTLEISGELTVLADERSNSLVIATAPQNFSAIEELIESLDGMLSQVLIEVLIIEASLDTDTKMGIEWTLLKQRTVSGDTHVGSVATDWNLASEAFGLKGSILESEGANKLLGFLLDNQERINILSTPMILTSDNKEATITVGSEVPYLKETRRSTGDTKDFVYEYRDVGIKLTVTPHINDERFVNLDVHQEIKKIGAQTLFDAFIIISREADATVVARDGQTVVLGGLMRDDETITRNSIPFLGDLPLIGKLFRNKDTVGEKTELLVFITPYVVTSQDEIDAITNKQKARLNSIIDKKQKPTGAESEIIENKDKE
jgi:general secretion pathway protein D